MDPEVPGSNPGGGTISSFSAPFQGHLLNGHARFAARAAALKGWAFCALDGPDSYLFEVTDGARRCVIAAGSASPYALNSASAMSLARDKGFAALALQRAGVPVIPGALFFATERHGAFRARGREPADAIAASTGFDYPVFCKPVSGSRGDFAEVIDDCDAFASYLARVSARHDAILAQPVVTGVEHRVIVLDGAAVCGYRKSPFQIIGDGKQALSALVAQARRAAKPTTATLAPAETARGLGGDGAPVGAMDVPAVGARVTILGPQNRSAGGDAEMVEAPARPLLGALGVAAAQALGLRFAGVDVFDVSPAGDLSALMVIEANASPALLTLEAHGRADLIDMIWAANLEAAFA